LRVGVVPNSLGGTLLLSHRGGRYSSTMVPMRQVDDPLVKLEAREFDATFIDLHAFDAHRIKTPGSKLVRANYDHPLGFNMGFAALATQRELIARIDTMLGELLASGAIAVAAKDTQLTYRAPREPAIGPAMSLEELRKFADR
jgi:hypothetical protein